MPKVRILSGSQAGSVVEMEKTEAESAIGTGYAESAETTVIAETAVKSKTPAKKPRKKPRRK